MKTICLDANIIVRFLQNDNKELSPKAKRILELASKENRKVYIDEATVAEVIWVLSSIYESPKDKIAHQMSRLVNQNWVINPRKKTILNALQRFSNSNLSYVDCWLLEICAKYGLKLETFDKDLQKTI